MPERKHEKTACKMVKVSLERLPDLNIPRANHTAFCANGEVVVAGGNTTGFVPASTAEYFRDGVWHSMQMLYSHDKGLVLPMQSGKVLMVGGTEKPFGIGRTFSAEVYDPVDHSFDAYTILNTKRTKLGGVELDDGRVLICGNWYGGDSLEMFNGHNAFSFVKEVSVHRTTPYILRISADDAVVFSTCGVYGERLDTFVVDRLKGPSFRVPFLDGWQMVTGDISNDGDNCFVGDVSKGDYTNLVAFMNQQWELEFVKVVGTDFSFLPTASPLPTFFEGDSIVYYQQYVDRSRGLFYLAGFNFHGRLFLLSVDYTRNPSPVVLYYTDAAYENQAPSHVLLPDGNVMLTGGYSDHSYFKALSSVYLLRGNGEAAALHASMWRYWWLLAVVAVAFLAYLLYIYTRKKKQPLTIVKEEPDCQEETDCEEMPEDDPQETLMSRIVQLMKEEKLYLNSELKIQDIANKLESNRTYISDCINTIGGCSFSHFVNTYRVAYAQQLMREKPDLKITQVYIDSGFANEMSFFRAFKSIVGMTPREWASQKEKGD